MSWNPIIKLVEGQEHQEFLRLAYQKAWNLSDDPKTKTGAVLVDNNSLEVLAFGVNHLPSGLEASAEKLKDSAWKYKHMIHAEPAAIYAAAREGNPTKGLSMYMPWVPCTPCALTIIDSGVSKLIGHKEMIMKTPERWRESTNYALSLLKNAGVELLMYEGKIGSVKGRFNEENWEP